MKTWLGIDLGTTYSCMAYVDAAGIIQVQKNDEGEDTTPSVVRYMNGEVVVGSTAKNEYEMYTDNTIETVKRNMGDKIGIEVDGKQLTPEDVSSEIIKKLVNDFRKLTEIEIEGVVVTHPAYFGSPARDATRQAVEKAGIKNIKLLTEPVAAAISYNNHLMTSMSSGPGSGEHNSRNILVYDLGGGTFDVTFVKQTGNNNEVIAIEGEKDLGGKDWDRRLRSYIAYKAGISEDDLNDITKAELSKKVEEWKKTLSKASISKPKPATLLKEQYRKLVQL